MIRNGIRCRWCQRTQGGLTWNLLNLNSDANEVSELLCLLLEEGEGGIFNTFHFSLFLIQSYRSKTNVGLSQSAHNQHLQNVPKYKQFAILNRNLFA